MAYFFSGRMQYRGSVIAQPGRPRFRSYSRRLFAVRFVILEVSYVPVRFPGCCARFSRCEVVPFRLLCGRGGPWAVSIRADVRIREIAAP